MTQITCTIIKLIWDDIIGLGTNYKNHLQNNFNSRYTYYIFFWDFNRISWSSSAVVKLGSVKLTIGNYFFNTKQTKFADEDHEMQLKATDTEYIRVT